MYPKENIVDVNFDITITTKSDGKSNNISELHKMRYLFEPEVELLLNNNGFELIKIEEWLTGELPSNNSWYVTFNCKKL